MSAKSIFFGQLFTRKLFAFAGNSLLVYDYFLTLPLEVAHIWNEPWTLVKSLFLINRYGNLIGQTLITLEETGYLSHGSRRFCIAFQIYCTAFAVFSEESIRVFVVMRACAILRFRRGIALFVNTLYILYAICILVLLIYLLMRFVGALEFEYLAEVGLCLATIPPTYWLVWLLPLFLDGFIMVVVCYNLYQFIRESRDIYTSRLIRLLARDALLFYLAALFSILFSIVCWTVYSQDPRSFLQTLITYPILTATGQRFILNPRRFRARSDLTRDISEEVNRQIAAMADMSIELGQLGTEPSFGTS